MKIKLLFLSFLIIFSASAFAQQDKPATENQEEKSDNKESENTEVTGKNELKLNLFATIYSALELSYERIFESNTALGITGAYCFNPNNSKGVAMEALWSLTPHYRLYFGKKQAAGFFIEANATAAHTVYKDYSFYRQPSDILTIEEHENFGYGLGFSVGAKFISARGYTGEAFFGFGRYINRNDPLPPTYPRLGITIGKRF